MRTVSLRRVAITGLGVVAPNASDRPSYTHALRQGKSGVTAIDGFDTSNLSSRVAGAVRGVDLAEGIDPKTLKTCSRVVPLALRAAREALADAGLPHRELDTTTRRECAVLLGTGGASIEFVESLYGHYYAGRLEQATVLAVPAGTPGTLSSEMSIHLGLRGPSHVISTGCTSSTDALGYAFRRIRYGEGPLALVGGADAPIAPAVMLGFDVMGIIARSWNHEPHRASRPFSRDRDGFVLAEGAWMLVLEDLERARARGASIYGEVLGYASTCDAWHRVSMAPDLEEPARAIELALADAALTTADVEYINLHGTGTELNDRVESTVVKRVFGDRAAEIPMSSTKSMLGHPQGACGAAGVAATLLSLNEGFLAPTINLDHPDPDFGLDFVPNVSRPTTARLALCNCMGFGSKNSALVIRAGDPAEA